MSADLAVAMEHRLGPDDLRSLPQQLDARRDLRDHMRLCSRVRIAHQDARTTITLVDAEVEFSDRTVAAKEMSIVSDDPGVRIHGPMSRKFKSEAARLLFERRQAGHLRTGIDAGMRESAKEHRARWQHVLTGQPDAATFHRFNAALAD